MGNQNVIELNGKRYDTRTGKIITASPVPHTASKKKPHHTSATKSIDGFAKAKAGTPLRQPNQATAHKTEKSKTLMRKTVAKPKQPAPVAQTTKAKPVINHTNNVDQKRLAHAQSIPKSTAVSRFSPDLVAQPKSHKNTAVKQPKTSTQATATAAASSVTATKTSIIDKALADAPTTSGKRLKKEKRSARVARKLHLTPRQVSFGGFAVALLLVVGFFAYQNVTNIGMRIASSRAGIKGNLPSYQPAGFGVAGGIAYNPGQITISYKSNSDNRNFKIMQNVSEWNSQALMDSYVAVNHPNNQTIQDRGKTVYIYDGSNATWVDGGIWYRIEGESQLNSDQLLNIAASL